MYLLTVLYVISNIILSKKTRFTIMKRIVVFILLAFSTYHVFGGDSFRPSRQKYIEEHKFDAVRDMKKTGIPASITLAQACLESQDGMSTLAKEANNHFGIKCSNWNGPSYIQDDDTKDECFRKYNSTLESYDDHSLFLLTRPRYAALFQLEITDYKGWAKGLKKAGYATDPNYAVRLIKIIEDNQLYQFDKMQESDPVASENNYLPEMHSSADRVYVPSVTVVDAFQTRKIFSINGVDYVIAKQGDDFKSIAQELKLGYWQLPKYNEMNDGTVLSAGQIVYIKPKKNEGNETVYTVKPGDTVLDIAQACGIKSKFIYKYNELKEGASIEAGQQLFLKKYKGPRS